MIFWDIRYYNKMGNKPINPEQNCRYALNKKCVCGFSRQMENLKEELHTIRDPDKIQKILTHECYTFNIVPYKKYPAYKAEKILSKILDCDCKNSKKIASKKCVQIQYVNGLLSFSGAYIFLQEHHGMSHDVYFKVDMKDILHSCYLTVPIQFHTCVLCEQEIKGEDVVFNNKKICNDCVKKLNSPPPQYPEEIVHSAPEKDVEHIHETCLPSAPTKEV